MSGSKSIRLPRLTRWFRILVVVALTPALTAAGGSNTSEEWAVRAPLAGQSLLLDAAVAGDRLVVVGERGHILVSDDQGEGWRQVDVPTRVTLTAVFFHDGRLGWAVGHDATVLRTRDGGDTWEQVHSAPEEELPLLDVWFLGPERGLAIGAYGYVLETNDGGSTWDRGSISKDEDFHLNQIARSNTGKIYLAAEAGTIYRSDDDGQTWNSLPSPYAGSFFGALPLEGDTVLLYGLRGRLFRSDDAGLTWQRLETNTEAMLTDARVLPPDTVVVTGLAGAVLVSRNGGLRFVLHQRRDRKGTAALIGAGSSLVFVGDAGVTMHTLEEIKQW